ncbi:MAG: type II toxin-antitoxin system HicB family antitoxin [Desulfovibrio sp.]|jgi:predicted RNase H-like HicB family nuclease|nr:type II toxin-antitoxin system HicB family antitoxin [Desulfovibrio sp.]
MAAYYGVITKSRKGPYRIEFPDLPGCATAGESPEELDAMARKALEIHLTALHNEGRTLPPPSSHANLHELHSTAKDFSGLTLVVASPSTKRVRVNVTMPESDLRYIDTLAKNFGMDRSAFIVFTVLQLYASKSKAQR